MKLSLDELKVDSYAVQASETELAEVKGGTGTICVDIGIALASVVVAGYSAWKSNGSAPEHMQSAGPSGGGPTIVYGVDSAKVNGQWYYGIDSLVVND